MSHPNKGAKMNFLKAIGNATKKGLGALWERIKNEPVIVINLINAGFALGVAFGLDITMEQKTAIIGFVTVLANVFARQMVTPTRKIPTDTGNARFYAVRGDDG